MERYDSYKDSGVDWIGQIPEHWNQLQLKYLVSCNDDVLPESTKNQLIKYVEISDVDSTSGIKQFTIYNFADAPSRARRITNIGDIIVSTVRTYLKAIARVDQDDFVVSTGFAVLRAKNINRNFLFYSLLNEAFLQQVIAYSYGVSFPAITSKELLRIKLNIPPFSEQQAIAAYLDKETRKLDAAVETLERMVEVLKERKQLIISKAVTRGLDDSVPLKDSGLEWIGQIPEHWSINRFKAIFTLNTGISFTKADLVETGQPVISYGQVHSKLNQVAKANLSLIKYIPQPLTIGKQKSYCLPNDFIFADTSEDFEGCGNNFYNDSELSVFAGSHTILAKLRCNIEGKYLAYLFSTSLWRQQIRSRVNGVKVFSITQSILKATSVILPPIAEQQAIAAYLDEKVGKLDEAIEKQLRMIELLKERKQILISDVVTGKIKVA